jgi:hypothetical protein
MWSKGYEVGGIDRNRCAKNLYQKRNRTTLDDWTGTGLYVSPLHLAQAVRAEKGRWLVSQESLWSSESGGPRKPVLSTRFTGDGKRADKHLFAETSEQGHGMLY